MGLEVRFCGMVMCLPWCQWWLEQEYVLNDYVVDSLFDLDILAMATDFLASPSDPARPGHFRPWNPAPDI